MKKVGATSCLLGEIENQEDSQNRFRDDLVKCPHCEKLILKLSFLMHEMHCAKVTKKIEKPSVESKEVKITVASRIKANPITTAKTDDFDELLEIFQKSNDTCSYKGCKVLTRTLGQNCEFCPNRFCLKHSLAEVHGCGEEAKRQARAHIRKEGNLDIRKKQSYSAELKHKVVEKKLHEKIQRMQDARSSGNKKDK